MKSVEIQIAALEETILLGRAGEAAYLMKVCAKHEIDKSTLERWMARVKNVPRSEWPTALRGALQGPSEGCRHDPRSLGVFYRAIPSIRIAPGGLQSVR